MNDLKTIDEKYEIQSEIKRGGFGVIFKGVDLLFGKQVAIKSIDPSLLGEAKYVDMFQAEALNIARLNHHNIVHVYDVRKGADGQFYIIMEYIDGPDLGRLLRACKKKNTPLPQHLAVYIIAEVCAGLDYAHNRRDPENNQPLNIVHQDISPANIMINRNGEVKIIDFGLANLRRRKAQSKKEVYVQGKINYLAPEQVNGTDHFDRRVDLFALGLVLYETLTGERFFAATDPREAIEQLRSGKWDASRLSDKRLPEKLQHALKRALSFHPDKRYANANLMYMDLMHYLIMSAPAADFTSEMAEFIEANYQETDAQEETTDSTAAGPIPGNADAEKVTNGETARKPEIADESTAKTERVDVDPKGSLSDTAVSDLLEISDDAVAEIDVQKAKPETAESADASAEKLETAKKDRTAKSKKTAKKKKEDAANSAASAVAPTETVASEETSAPQKTEPAGKEAESLIPLAKKKKPETAEAESDFYSIIEYADEDEEVKTIIDVVRLSARTHKKGLVLTAISLIAAMIGFTVVDTFARFTAIGENIYDYLFPPAVRISSIPTGAEVYLDDKPLQETTPVSIPEISPGVHKLMLTMPRFEPIVKSINVPRKGQLQVAGESSRHPSQPYVFQFKSQLELSSQPPGAEVYIDDVKLSKTTPTTIYWEVRPEPIRIKMARPGFPEIAGMQIDMLTGMESIEDRRFWKFQRLDRTKDHFAIEGIFRKNVTISSVPSRAEIYLNDDDRPVGITGVNGNLLLTIGQHVVTLRKSGYIPRTFSITIDEETPEQIKRPLLRNVRIFAKSAEDKENEADLEARIVELRLGRKKISVNQETPAELKLLPYRYTALLQKHGYEDLSVTITPGAKNVLARLKPVEVEVTFAVLNRNDRSPIEGAQVFYSRIGTDGTQKRLSTTDDSGIGFAALPVGRYRFSIVKTGYKPKQKILNVRLSALNRFTFLMAENEVTNKN